MISTPGTLERLVAIAEMRLRVSEQLVQIAEEEVGVWRLLAAQGERASTSGSPVSSSSQGPDVGLIATLSQPQGDDEPPRSVDEEIVPDLFDGTFTNPDVWLRFTLTFDASNGEREVMGFLVSSTDDNAAGVYSQITCDCSTSEKLKWSCRREFTRSPAFVAMEKAILAYHRELVEIAEEYEDCSCDDK